MMNEEEKEKKYISQLLFDDLVRQEQVRKRSVDYARGKIKIEGLGDTVSYGKPISGADI